MQAYQQARTLRLDVNGVTVGKTAIAPDNLQMVTVDIPGAKEVTFPRNLIHSAKLVLTDELIAATQPLDTSGADDIEEEKADD